MDLKEITNLIDYAELESKINELTNEEILNLHNSLSKLIHVMKIAFSNYLLSDYPISDEVISQLASVKTIESIQEIIKNKVSNMYEK